MFLCNCLSVAEVGQEGARAADVQGTSSDASLSPLYPGLELSPLAGN